MKYDPLFLSPQWLKEYNTKYPHGMSVLENIIEWLNQTNKLIDYVNLTPDKILTIMEQWKTDGTFDEIMDTFFNHVQTNLTNLTTRFDNADIITVKDFGAKGDGTTDDHAAFTSAIASFAPGQINSGKVLLIPEGNYKLSAALNINYPMAIWGNSPGTSSDLNKGPVLDFTNSSGFVFSESAGYCDFRDLRLYGVKNGVNLTTASYGNVAMHFIYGAVGKFESIRIEGFDIGVLTRQGESQTWAGAYRYFNYLKLRNNHYSVAQLDFTTDNNFFQCDFRDATISKKGFLYFEADSSGYQTTNLIDCMFELLGETTAPRNYDNYGIQVKGKNIVRIIGGYLEAVSIFVGKKASLISTAYHRYGSGATIIGGDGYINMDGVTGSSKPLNIPGLSDTAYWIPYNCTMDGIEAVDNIRAFKFTATGETPSLSSSDYNTFNEASMQALPLDATYAYVLAEVEFKAPAGRRLLVTPQGVSQATYTDETYHLSTGNWQRMSFVFPVLFDRNDMLNRTVRPQLILSGGQTGDIFYIRALKYRVFAE